MFITAFIVIMGSLMIVEPTVAQGPISSFDRRYSDNGYHFGFKTIDGSERDESGSFTSGSAENPDGHKILRVNGFYQYVDTNKKLFRVKYVADDMGFQPTVEAEHNEKLQQISMKSDLSPIQQLLDDILNTTTSAGAMEVDEGLTDDRIQGNVIKTLLG